MKAKLEQLKKLLGDADTLAKEIADALPTNGIAQALRGRCNSAADLADHVVLPEEKPQPKAEPAKK
jgi:hypothetical protein